MNQIDRNKIIRSGALLLGMCVAVGIGSRVLQHNSLTLAEYAALQTKERPDQDMVSSAPNPSEDQMETLPETAVAADEETASDSSNTIVADETPIQTSTLIGATLNAESPLETRSLYAEGFYYEPLSANLVRFITGVSYPAADVAAEPVVTCEDLRYVHILHYDFNGEVSEGELICHAGIAEDLVQIFYELYRNEYRLEKVLLMEEYDGEDTAAMEDNNTSCFLYRTIEGSESLSRHAYGLAVDINPLYNPHITYTEDGAEIVAPASAAAYTDRTRWFPYKIDKDDLCYQLFTAHGFTWGGDWNSSKDYQHFQKTLD